MGMLRAENGTGLPTIAERIAADLRRRILGAEIAPGTPIRQGHIAADYGVSQAPVREALGLLAAEELVDYHPNRGVRVAALDPGVVAEISALRLALETELAGLAAGNFTAEDRVAAEAALAAIADAGDAGDLLAGNDAFHTAIYRPAGRPITLDMVRRLRARYGQYLGYMWTHSAHAPASLAEHRYLLSLMIGGKGEAAVRTLRRHIAASTRAILDCLAARENS